MRILGMRKIAHTRQAEKPFSLTARNCLSPWIQYPPNLGSRIEGGEGSSAANVSMLQLASPSQTLTQIRRRKKQTRDEMFSELMQSTQTERAQQNAWRQTMPESRKAQNEEQQERWQQHDERRQDTMLRLPEDQTDMLWCMVEVQERQRPPLQLLCNQPPSSPSSITSSPRRPRTRGMGELRARNQSTPEDCPSNRRLAFNKF
nr:uncharacterized protein LOC125645231 [Caretta caretta]